MLVSCAFHGCQVKETSNSCFGGSIEFETSSMMIDLHMWFVCTKFQTNPKVPFDVLRVDCFSSVVGLSIAKGTRDQTLAFAKGCIRDHDPR